MSSEKTCPQCGAALPSGLGATQIDSGSSRDTPSKDERETPAIELLAPGSNDETFLAAPFGPKMTSAEPDPILGNFVTPASVDSVKSLSEIDLNARRPSREARRAAESPPSFPSLNLDRSPKVPGQPSSSSGDLGSDDEERQVRRNSWISIWLVSYASALTIALGWTLWQRFRDRDRPIETPPPESQATVGHQAGLSRKIAQPEPILGHYTVALKTPLTIGSLEVTPLEIRREAVSLQRNNLSGISSKVERRDGGKNALVLKLRLRNTSKDVVFAPLDQAFLREQEKEVVDTYIETMTGERIYPFPLAVESEWSILGQDFSALRPGESRVVSIVSPPNSPAIDVGPLTWRVRLRSGIDRTDVIGVRWNPPAAPSK